MVLKTFKEGEIPNDSQKGYHRFDRIATKMYGAAGSNAVDAGMAVWSGGADILLDYMANPILILYSAGLNPPRDILILVSRYHTI
jgi:hypothetical protein